jgi:hypothetical protein
VFGLELDLLWQLRLFEQHLRDANASGVPDANNAGLCDHVTTL